MNVLMSLLFTVSLDGRDIGEHRFELVERGEARELLSEARFRVSVLGIPAYRYEHQATERWRGDCLEALVSSTRDGLKRYAVDWRAQRGCTMSFAYWNPRILGEKALLNAQTGELEPVRVTPLGAGAYRVQGRELAIELRYDEGRWVGLETDTPGGRLRYRLAGAK